MARIYNEVRDKVLAKLVPIKKTTQVEKVVHKIIKKIKS